MTKSKEEVNQSLKELYQNQNKIPPFIEGIEGMKEYDLKEYYVRLKTILKENEEANQSSYEVVLGEKINIEVNYILDSIKDQDPVSKVLILGGAGVGKSTLMQYMSFKWSSDQIWNNKFDAVYRVALKTLLNGSWKTKYMEDNKYASEIDKEPLRYIIHYNIVRVANENLSARQLLPEDIDFTDSSKILFLLDGYDEVAHMDDPLYQNLESQIFQQKNLILTSRPNAIIPSFKSKFERIIENIGLDNDGIDLFTKLYFKGSTPQIIKKYKAIDHFLSTNASVKNICNVPVNIAMLCYIFQEQEEEENLQILNASQLYYLVVKKLGERFISKEYKGSGFESQSLSDKIEEKLRNLPEIKALKHIAYSGMTGGGVEINDSVRKESLIIKSYKDTKDEYQASIQKSIEILNVKTNINKIVKYGLLKQEGENQKNRDYSFIHLSFQEYLTAQYLADKLIEGSDKEKLDVITYISTHRNEPRLLVTLKFMAGIITSQKNTEIINDFWNSVVCNVEGILEFSLIAKVKLLMNLLGQAKIKDEQLDSRIPNLGDIINLIDVVVISNIQSFKETLKDSDYLSKRIQKLILKLMEESRDLSFQIIQEMKILNSVEPIQQLINYIADQQRDQDQTTNSEVLKLRGLELISYLPHKFEQELISKNIMEVISNENAEWNKKQIALTIFNSVAPKLKGSEINKLKQNIFQFLLSNNVIELYDISLESLKYLYYTQQITPIINEQIFALLEQILTYQLKNSLFSVTNIVSFIKHISINKSLNLEIQKLVTFLTIDYPKQYKDAFLHLCTLIESCLLIPEILMCIEKNERSQIAQNLLKILCTPFEGLDDVNIGRLLKLIPRLLEFVNAGEKFQLAKQIIPYFEKLVIDQLYYIHISAAKSTFKIITLFNSNERQSLLKQQIKVLKNLLESQNENQLEICRSIPEMIYLLNFDERLLIIKEIINPLLKQLGTSEIINPKLGELETQDQSNYLVLKSKILLSIPKLLQIFNIEEKQVLCKDILKQIMSENIQVSGVLCELTPIMIELVNQKERQTIAKEVFDFLLKQIKNNNKNNELLQSGCNAIFTILFYTDEAERQNLCKELFITFESFLGYDFGEYFGEDDTIFRKIIKVLKNMNAIERTHFSKQLLKSLEKIMGDKEGVLIRMTALKFIPKGLKYVDLLERSQIAEDVLQFLENQFVEDQNIQQKLIIKQKISLILMFVNQDKRQLLAKNFIKSLQKLTEDEEDAVILHLNEFYLCFEKVIELIDKDEKQIFINFVIKLLEKLLASEKVSYIQQALEYFPKVIEQVNITERESFVKKIIKEYEKSLESRNHEVVLKACEYFPLVIKSLLTKPIQKKIESKDIQNTESLAKSSINSLKNLLEHDYEKVQDSAVKSIQEILQIVDLNERSTIASEIIKFLEEKVGIGKKQHGKALECIIKLFDNLNITEKTQYVDQFVDKLNNQFESIMNDDFTYSPFAVKALSNFFDSIFTQNHSLTISNKIIDCMLNNKQKSVVDYVQQWYFEQFSCLKSQYQFISKIEDSENNICSLSILYQDFLSEYDENQVQIPNEEFLDLMKTMNKIIFKSDEKARKSKIKSLLLNFINHNFCKNYNFPHYKMIHILLCIIGNESEDVSSHKEMVKEAKNMVGLILKYLDQTGIDWIMANLWKLTDFSYFSQKVVSKICIILLEDGIISDNESFGGLNEFKVLVDVIKSSGNISLNDRGAITVDGKRYTLQLDDNGRISLDKEVSELLKNHKNPFIKQYFEYKPVFLNNSQRLVANLDKRQYSIADNEWSNKKWDSVIDQKWKLVELEKYNGGKIVFFEKKDIFGKRIVLKINEYEDSKNSSKVIKIFDNNREKIFGKYSGPMMFYVQLSTHDSWRNNAKDDDFINSFQNKDKLDDKVISDKQILFHDGLLCMDVTSDRMQDIVFFEFMKTIKDQEEELKHEIRKMGLQNHEKAFLEYYGAFLKTFSLCYTEAQVIVSGKFSFDVSNTGVTVLSKLASIIPLIGDIASSAITSIGEFIVSVGIQRKANSFLQFAHDHSNLSKKAGLLAKQIILKKGAEFVRNNFEVGYVSMFLAALQSEKYKISPILPNSKLSEIANRILKIKSGIEAKIYSELYVGDNAKLGNEDATKFIEMITNNGLSKDVIKPTQLDENLDKMYEDIEYKYIENNNSQSKKMERGGGEKGSSCCKVFMMNCARYDNPLINLNKNNVEFFILLRKMNQLEKLNEVYGKDGQKTN